MANNVKARLVPKNESLIDWRKSGYVPKLGEILTATKSSNDSKSYIIVGDGDTNTQQLPAIGVADHLIPQFFNISEIKEYRNSDIDFIGFLSDQQAIHVGEEPKEVFGLFYCGKDSIESDDSTKYIHFYNNNLTFKIDDIAYYESSAKYVATEIITKKTFSKNIIFSKIDSLERLIKSEEGKINFIGTSTTDPSTGTVIVNGVSITPKKGDIVYYNAIEFIYDGYSWVEIGDTSGLQQQIDDLASSINTNRTNIATINNNITNINQNITTLEEKIDNIDIDVDFNIEYGDELPTTGEEGDIYLLNSSGGGEGSGLDIADEEGYVQYINYDAEGNIILENGQTYYYIDGTGSNKTYKEFTYTTGATLPVYEDTDYLLGNTVNVYFIKRLIPTVQIKNDINVNIHNINELKGINFADTGAEADDGKYGPYDPLDRDIYVRGGTLQSTKNWDFNGRYIGHIHYNENDFKPGELIDRNDYVASTGLLKDYRVNPFNYSTVSMFPSIAVIGDSWSCGSIYFGDTDIDGSYNAISWPTILCAKNGIKLFNYSASGMEANTFVSGKYASASLDKAISDCDTYSPDLYVVALGYNEQQGAGTPGTEDKTFCGSLTTIYNRLSAKNPNAKWIIIKQPTTQENPTLPTGISEGCASIANYIGCPHIDSDEDKFFLTDFYKNNLFTDNVSNHPIAATYAGIANAYDRLISKCIVDNVDYFKYFYSDNERTTTTSSSDIDLTEYAKLTDLNNYVLKNNSGDTYITTSGNFIVRKDSNNTPLYLAYIATPNDDAKNFAANVDYVQKYFAKTKITGDQLPSVAVRTDKNAVFDNRYVGGLNYETDGTGLETYRNQTKYAAPVGFVKEYVAEYVDTQLNAIETLLEKI